MNKDEILKIIEEAKDSGVKIVGVFSHQMVPEELIHASGAIPLKLCFSGSEDVCMKGTEYLTPATCPLARSVVGHFEEKNPFYSLLDAFIGGNYCNGDLCASEYISKYFNVPFIHFSIPWVVNDHSTRFYEKLLHNLKNDLENTLKVHVNNEALINSIKKYNQVRMTFQDLVPKIGMGSRFQQLMNEFYLLGPEKFLENFNVKQNHGINEESNGFKIAFTGSYVAIDDFILKIIEECNLQIVYNDSESIFYYENLVPPGEPFSSLNKFYLTENYSSRMFNSEKRTNLLISKAKSMGLKGVILHVLKYCDPYVAIKKDMMDHLKDEGFSVLELERDYDQSLGQLKTRIEAFKEMIE